MWFMTLAKTHKKQVLLMFYICFTMALCPPVAWMSSISDVTASLRTAPNWIALVVGVGGNGRWRGLMVWFRWRGCWLVHHGQTATAGSLGPPLFGHPAGWIGLNCWRAAWLAGDSSALSMYIHTHVSLYVPNLHVHIYIYITMYICTYILCYDYVYTYIYTYRYTRKLHINTEMDCSEGDSWKFNHFGDG